MQNIVSLDWSKINTVLLDMDGTLLDLHFDNYFWRQYIPSLYAKKHKINKSKALAILTPLFAEHEGSLNWYCVDFWSAKLDMDIMLHKSELTDKVCYRADAEAFLAFCQLSSAKVRLVTNAHRKVLNLKISVTQLDQYFDSLSCSHEFNYPKETPQFWSDLHQQYPFDPQATVFIDDSEVVLDSAHDYGIQHLYSIATPDSLCQRNTDSKYPMLDSLLALV